MTLLVIDTCTERLIAGVRGPEDRWLNLDSGGNHARDLIDAVDTLLAASVPDAIGVAVGPGSFTGVRIGLSMAKGLAEGWNVPLVALDNLEAMAASWAALRPAFPGPVLCAIDARKQRFYGGLYHGGKTLIPPSDLSPNDWREAVRRVWSGPVSLSGYQGTVLAAAMGPLPADWETVPGHDWAPALLDQAERGWRASTFLPPEAGPRYLRLSEAEEERLKRESRTATS